MYLYPDESAAKELLIEYCQKKNISFIEFVKSYRRKHPDLGLGEALIKMVEGGEIVCQAIINHSQ